MYGAQSIAAGFDGVTDMLVDLTVVIEEQQSSLCFTLVLNSIEQVACHAAMSN
jgi:hypothetical protein